MPRLFEPCVWCVSVPDPPLIRVGHERSPSELSTLERVVEGLPTLSPDARLAVSATLPRATPARDRARLNTS